LKRHIIIFAAKLYAPSGEPIQTRAVVDARSGLNAATGGRLDARACAAAEASDPVERTLALYNNIRESRPNTLRPEFGKVAVQIRTGCMQSGSIPKGLVHHVLLRSC
jgi:hypothetical protein